MGQTYKATHVYQSARTSGPSFLGGKQKKIAKIQEADKKMAKVGIFLSLPSDPPGQFLSDPGIPGVRSMGPVVTH